MIKPAQIPAKIIEAILLTKTNLGTRFSIEDPKCLTRHFKRPIIPSIEDSNGCLRQ